MAATFEAKVYTGTNAGTESPAGDATNLNLQSIDAYDSTGTDYQTNKMSVPTSGTNYSFERWIRGKFTGTFNSITNVLFWKSAGTLSDVNLAVNAGENTTGVTPIDSVSTIATSAIPTTEGTAIDITPAGGISVSGDFTDYVIMQLAIPSTVTTPGDIGSQTVTFQYDEA